MDTPFRITKVVQANELEIHTLHGWVLIQPVLSSYVQHLNYQGLPQVCHGSSTNNYGYQVQPISLQADQVVQVHAFLIGLDEESSIAHLKKQLDEANSRAQSAVTAECVAQQNNEQSLALLTNLEKKLDKETLEHNEARKLLNLTRDEVVTLKQKLANIKQAIGTKTYDEILT